MNSFSIVKKLLFVLFLISIQLTAQIPAIKVACVGNSITAGAGLANPNNAYPQQLGGILGNEYQVVNFGVSGRTMLKKGDSPYWKEPAYQEALKFKPQILIICLGTNDSKPWNWVYKNDFFGDYSDMVNSFRQGNPNIQIFTCFPTRVFHDNFGITDSIIHYQIIPLIDSVRKTENTDVIDFYDQVKNDSADFHDGIHPDSAGAAIMANIAYNSINNSPSGIIRYFAANSYKFEKGQSVKLYWNTTTGSQVSINGSQVNETDSMIVQPTQTTTYTLITNGINSDTNKITLQYLPPGIIKTFTADNLYLDKGYKESSHLKWAATIGSHVTLNGLSVGENDSVNVSPDSTITYKLIATGDTSDTSSITIKVLESSQINRALHQSANASQSFSTYYPENAVDGDTTTYWESQAFNPQWITVDMKNTYEINRVVLRWEKVYATSFQLQVITEANDTTTIFSTDTATGGINNITGLTGKGRYLRLLCLSQNYSSFGYRLEEFEIYGTPAYLTSVKKYSPANLTYRLYQNFPNPFNPSTTIEYSIPKLSHVTLKIYDTLGNEVKTLVNEEKLPGDYKITFDGSKLASGVYFSRIVANDFVKTKKIILLK
ncbi:MAG: GDSL-type esterase/lipase family protein [Bacteroidetes bacterium]|nr:GDSL-type esterase/lipase family protein [Bacteroidota bacterium]